MFLYMAPDVISPATGAVQQAKRRILAPWRKTTARCGLTRLAQAGHSAYDDADPIYGDTAAMPMFVDTSPPGHCIFCKIVAGEIPAAKVYEDDLTLAFMDIGQVNPGHVLVASKRHAVTVLDLTPQEAAAVMQTAQRIARAAQQALAPDGLTLFQANGAAGGQTVFHFHLHVLPRHAEDGVALTWPRKEPGAQQLQAYAAQLQAALHTAG